jgi:ABC-type sugar transport system ATPase subunit
MALIHVKNLVKQYVNEDVVTPVLHGVTFDIAQGEFVAIMGPSGSGKSTLMHILSFLDRPTSGTYEFEGNATSSFTDDYLASLRNERIGFVFQSFNLLPRTTVLDNVKLPLLYSKKKNQTELAKKALDAVIARSEQNVLIVTHGEILRMMLSVLTFKEDLTPKIYEAMKDTFVPFNTGVTKVNYDTTLGYNDSGWYVHTWNDHAHLGTVN